MPVTLPPGKLTVERIAPGVSGAGQATTSYFVRHEASGKVFQVMRSPRHVPGAPDPLKGEEFTLDLTRDEVQQVVD